MRNLTKALIVLILAACSPTNFSESTASPLSPVEPSETLTPLVSTTQIVRLEATTATPDLVSTITASGPVIAVTFDGQNCTISGPGQVPIGSLVIHFENLSGKPASPWLDRRYPDKTWQDVIMMIGTPGAQEVAIPNWIALLPFRSTVNASPTISYDLYDVTIPAEYDIVVEVPDDLIWPCGEFEVIGEP